MELNKWVRNQIRGKINGVIRSQDFFDAEMFRTWAIVSTQAGFSIWDLIIEIAGDRGITRLLKQLIWKIHNEQRPTGNA